MSRLAYQLAALTLGAAVAAAPGAASAVDLTGRLGFLADRQDDRDAGTHSLRLDFDGSLDLRGALVAPGVVDYDLNGGYQGMRLRYPDTSRSSSDAYTYGGLVSLFENRESKLALTGLASRSRVDFAVDPVQAARLTGATTVTSYGVQARGGDGVRPNLRLGLSSTESVNTGLGRPETSSTVKQLDVGLQHGPGAYNVAVDYQGRWGQGSFDAQDYDSHSVDLNASANVAQGVRAFLAGRWFQRNPTTVSALALATEDNRSQAGVTWQGEGSNGSVSYVYDHFLASAPLLAERERYAQSMEGWWEHVVSPQWQLVSSAGLSMTQDRLGTLESRATGETAGLLVRWIRPLGPVQLSVEAGPRLGLLQPESGPSKTGYGAFGRASVNGLTGLTAWSAQYSLDYQDQLGGLQGWSLRQGLYGDASRPLARDVYARLSLSANSDRQQSSILGGSAARNANLRLAIRWGKLDASVEAGAVDGLTGSLADPIRGDGLFLPVSFDSHQRFVAVQLAGELVTNLTWTLRARHTSLSGPEVQAQSEDTFTGSLQYAIGLWALGLDARYTTGGASGQDLALSEVIFRISRSFGARF